MIAMLQSIAARVIPRAVRAKLKRLHRDWVFTQALRRWAALGPDSEPPQWLLQRLIYGWGNERFAARADYLLAISSHAHRTRGPILECGSGLSTVLLGLITRQTGSPVWALEHIEPWAEQVRTWLRRYGVDRVEVCLSELHDYGSFTWYRPPARLLEQSFSLVICDGPPGDTPGGRYGLLPVMRKSLSPGCVILLDDVKRPGERAALSRWSEELGASYSLLGDHRKFGKIILP
jgi:predicted O-methyltransferase YrrM